MNDESKIYESFGRWAHAAILSGADNVRLLEKANEMTQKLVEIRSPFRVDQIVFVLRSASILKAEIKELGYSPGLEDFRYELFETTGRRLGWFDRRELFASKEELIQFYTNILK